MSLYMRNGYWMMEFSINNKRVRRSTRCRNEIEARALHDKTQAALLSERKAIQYEKARAAPHADAPESWMDAVDSAFSRTDGGWIGALYKRSKSRAAKRNIDFLLTKELIRDMAIRSRGQCSITGVQFYCTLGGRHPFTPSIDRIDNRLGYIPSNVRLVCSSVNVAMNVWGEDAFAAMAFSYVSKKLHEMVPSKITTVPLMAALNEIEESL